MSDKTTSWFTAARMLRSIVAVVFTVVLLVLVMALTSCSSVIPPASNLKQDATLVKPTDISAFVVSGFVVNPSQVNAGDAVSIIANVTNTSTTKGTYDAVLRINNAVVISKALAIPGGATQTLNFVVPTNNPGTYEAAFGGLTGTFTVADNSAKIVPISGTSSPSSAPNSAAAPNCCDPSQKSTAATDSVSSSCCGSPTAITPSTSNYSTFAKGGGCCGR